MTPREVAERVTTLLQALNVPYMFVGSFSSNQYGNPRSTKDAYLVVQLDETSINAIMAALGNEFSLESQMSFETVTAPMRYRIRCRSTDFLVELFLLSDDPHDRMRFERRRNVSSDKGSWYVAAPEDVIVTKLRWSNGGRRHKDIDDILNVIETQTPQKLDLDYIRNWSDQHGTRSLFEKLLAEAQA